MTYTISREIGIDVKQCYRCNEAKLVTEFNKKSSKKDGLHHLCKTCHRAQTREAYGRRREAHIVHMSAWKKDNRERAREIDRTGSWKNRERKIAMHVDANRKRRACVRTGKIDAGITMSKVYTRDKGICMICKEVCPRGDASLDHIVPLSKGGSHTWDNVQLAHFNCNSRKKDTLL